MVVRLLRHRAALSVAIYRLEVQWNCVWMKGERHSAALNPQVPSDKTSVVHLREVYVLVLCSVNEELLFRG